MDEGGTTEILIGAFRLDRRAGTLFRRDERGATVPVAIGSRGFAVLDLLVARCGELVSKNEIMRTVWSERVVEDNNLTVQITAPRRVLDQGLAGGSCIQTILGRGYRFVAPVMRVDADAHSATQIISDDGGRSRRLSIVVPPFNNLSNDPEQQYFVLPGGSKQRLRASEVAAANPTTRGNPNRAAGCRSGAAADPEVLPPPIKPERLVPTARSRQWSHFSYQRWS